MYHCLSIVANTNLVDSTDADAGGLSSDTS